MCSLITLSNLKCCSLTRHSLHYASCKSISRGYSGSDREAEAQVVAAKIWVVVGEVAVGGDVLDISGAASFKL